MITEQKKTHPIDLCVSERLRKKRLELKLTQKKLGEAVNLTFQQIQKYEKGLNRICVSKLYEIARVMNTKIAYFFSGLDFSSQDCKHVDKYLSMIRVEETKYRLADNQNIPFSPRESECICAMLLGKSTKEIARELNISPRTVEAHIHNIKSRLNCYSKSQVISKISFKYANKAIITNFFSNVISEFGLEDYIVRIS